MSMCSICLEGFKRPLSLPCGHVFCTECLCRTVQAVQPPRNFHSCPTCRAAYSTVPLNSSAVPPHLRPFVSAGIRRVYLEGDAPSTADGSAHPSTPSISHGSSDELVRLRAENQTLRSHCVLWRRRAELHGAATLGLLDFARMVRDQATSLARERDELKRQCGSLKRKLEETGSSSQQASPVEPPSLPSFTFAFPPESFGRTIEESRLAASSMFDWNSCTIPPTSTSSPSSTSSVPSTSTSQRHRPSSSTISTGSRSTPSLDSRLLERPTKRLRQNSYPAQGVPPLHVPISPRNRPEHPSS